MCRTDCHQCILCTHLWLHGLCLGRLCRLCRCDVAVLFRRAEEVSYCIRLEGYRKVCGSSHCLVFGIRRFTIRECMGIVGYPYFLVDSVCVIYCEERFPTSKFAGDWKIFQINEKRKCGTHFLFYCFISSLAFYEPNLLPQNQVFHPSTICCFQERRIVSNHLSF